MSRVKLGDVAKEHKEVFKGDKTRYPIVGLEHLIPKNIKLENWDIDVDNTFTKMFRKGNVLFGRRRAYLKKAAYADVDGICSGDITVIEAIPGKIHPELLPFIIQNDDLFDFAVGKSAGSLSPRVKWEHLKNYEFELVDDIEKQKYLADLLWSMIETKSTYELMINAIDELLKSQFIELVKDKDRTIKIKDVCDLNIENISRIFSKDSIINYVEISSIDGNSKKITNSTILRYGDAPSSAKYLLELGDVLVSLVRPNLKKISINDLEGNNVIGTTGFCVLRAKGFMTPQVLLAIVMSDQFTESMISSATGSTYPTIKDSDVLNYPIWNLNQSEINTFTHLTIESNKSKFNLQQSIAELDGMIRKILTENFKVKEE